MIELLKTLRDTPVPSILVIGGIVFLLLAFVRKAGNAIEPEPSQRGWTILTGIILLLSGVSLYLVPPAQPVTTPTPTVFDIPTSTSLPATATNTPQTVSQFRPAFLFKNLASPFQSRDGLDPTITPVDTGDDRISYILEYDLPQNEYDQYAGFVIFSDEPTDVADYKYIRVVVTFGDPEAECELILRDFGINREDEHDDEIRYVRLDDSLTTLGGKIETSGNTYTFLIPVSSLVPINLKEIRQIGFQANTKYTTGKHSMVIEDISFTNAE
jgi:hypothetical protein